LQFTSHGDLHGMQLMGKPGGMEGAVVNRESSVSGGQDGQCVDVGVSGQAHDLTGCGCIALFFSQIQQSNLVFDDSLVSIVHEGYLPYILTV